MARRKSRQAATRFWKRAGYSALEALRTATAATYRALRASESSLGVSTMFFLFAKGQTLFWLTAPAADLDISSALDLVPLVELNPLIFILVWF